MVEQVSNVEAGERGGDGEEGGFDIEKLRELVGFAFRAPLRHPLLSAAAFALVAALGVTISVTMPKSYQASVRLLAQRSTTIRALSSPNAREMEQVDDPTKDVAAMILRRDNLVALAKDTNLVERFYRTRSSALKFKDRVMAFLFGPPTEEEMTLGQVYTLDKKLWVNANADTIEFGVDWNNALTAYEIVTQLQKNFVEARYDSEVAVINDGISLLETRAKSELAQVDQALADYQKLVAERSAPPAASAAPAARPVSAGPAYVPATSSAGVKGLAPVLDESLAKQLEEKRTQIRALEDTRARALDALRRQLVEARLTLTPLHPTVVALQQQVDGLSEPSPDLVQLRADERALMEQIAIPRATALGAPSAPLVRGPTTSGASEPPPGTTPAVAAVNLQMQLIDRDGVLQLGQSKLASAAKAYEDTMARIDSAKVELDITRTSFKHRYTVLQPAEMPKKPKKPLSQLIGIGSVVGALLLAILLPTGADLLGGRILESWQVKRRLNIEVLAEFDTPASPTS